MCMQEISLRFVGTTLTCQSCLEEEIAARHHNTVTDDKSKR